MNITITYAQPSTLNLYRLNHEWPVRDSIQNHPKPNGGYPETCKTRDDHWEKMNSTREWWWFNMFRYNAPPSWDMDTLTKKWLGYMDGALAWTNQHGSDEFHSYVAGTNTSAEDMAQETLICKGNVVNVIGAPEFKMGTNWYPIEAVDSLKPLPSWEQIVKTPHLCHESIILYKDGSTSPFPHLDGNPVPLPVIIKGGVMWVAEYDDIGGVRQKVLEKI